MTGKNEDDLATVVMGMHADCRTRNQNPLEDSVGTIKEHIGSKILLTTLEIWKDRKVHFVEINNHRLKYSSLKNLRVTSKDT